MKKLSSLLMAFLLMPALLSAQQRPSPEMRERREMLEARIVKRFMDRVSTNLALEPASRTRLEQHLRGSGEQRRMLASGSARLRMRLQQAVRDTETSEAEFRRLIDEMSQLREREEQLWRADQEALSRILTPRQHARFILDWIQFNEQIRNLATQRRRAPGEQLPWQ